jgi:hypothetical protein
VASRRRAPSAGKGRGALTPAALQRVVPRPRAAGYVDPRTKKVYTAAQVRAAKAAAGWTPQITAALKAKGFGTSFAQQRTAAKLFRATQPARERRGLKDPNKDFARTAELALRARDNLSDLVEHYRRGERQAGRRVSKAQALAPGSKLWRAVKDLSAPRTVTRAGVEHKVGPTSKVARALVAVGLRPSWATWRVGDSPSLERVAAFLGRDLSSWDSLTPAEIARVNGEAVEGGALARPTKTDYRPAETAALAIIGKRAPNDPRGIQG